jgi:hypothetical protein
MITTRKSELPERQLEHAHPDANHGSLYRALNVNDIWVGLGEDLVGVYQGGPFHAFDGIIVYK